MKHAVSTLQCGPEQFQKNRRDIRAASVAMKCVRLLRALLSETARI